MADWMPEIEWGRAAAALGALLAGCAAGFVVAWVASAALRGVASEMGTVIGKPMARRVRRPLLAVGVLLGAQATLLMAGGAIEASEQVVNGVRHGVAIALIVGVAWLIFAAVNGFEEGVVEKYDIGQKDNRRARRARTQVQVLTRALEIFIVIVAVSLVLMTFEPVRRLGASLLTGAGVAGLVVGFAAKPVLSNLIAGIQIALTEPIALDDVVIVEGEWGRVEEITATYVVVRIWDDRRMITPLTYFLEKPFQNWTRRTSELLGTAFVWADHRVDVDAVREELKKVCEESDKWDGRVCLVQVTDTSEGGVQLRALVSAANSGDLWDLRCLARERLVRHLEERQEGAVPRTRVELYEDAAWEEFEADAEGGGDGAEVGGEREMERSGDDADGED